MTVNSYTGYTGKYPVDRARLRHLSISNGHPSDKFRQWWSYCIRKEYSLPDILSRFDDSVLSKPIGFVPEIELKRIELRDISRSYGYSSRQFDKVWARISSTDSTIDEITLKFYQSSISRARHSDKPTVKSSKFYSPEVEEMKTDLINKGYYSIQNHVKYTTNAFSTLMNQWNQEGIDTSEMKRRITASHYHYEKSVGLDLKSKGLIPPTNLFYDPLSHLYTKFATIAYNNNHIVVSRGKTSVSLAFRNWWRSVAESNHSEQSRNDSFNNRGFNKPRQ